MRIPRRVGRFRAVLAAVVLAIGALAAVPAATQTAVATQPAVALDACTSAVNPLVWQQIFSSRGVTVCIGNDGSPPEGDAYVQIIDLNAGAKIRLISDGCYECPYSDTQRNSDLQYHKRTAEAWFDWLQDPANLRTPGPSRLLSTSNGSFFVDPSPSTHTSKLSLPVTSLREILPGGSAYKEFTYGWAYGSAFNADPDDLDPAWNKEKLAISLGDSTAAKQKVQMLNFATNYDHPDVSRLFSGGYLGEPVDWNRVYGDATVGFTPTDTVGASPRTYLGVDEIDIADKVYILNAAADLTGAQAQQIIESFGAAFTMQLDGGGSTQLAVDFGQDGDADYLVESDDPLIDREVPDTLAVYLGP